MQQRSKARRVRRSGMTLIEVMIVVVKVASEWPSRRVPAPSRTRRVALPGRWARFELPPPRPRRLSPGAS
jgi:hypothetical protein